MHVDLHGRGTSRNRLLLTGRAIVPMLKLSSAFCRFQAAYPMMRTGSWFNDGPMRNRIFNRCPAASRGVIEEVAPLFGRLKYEG